MNDEDLWTTDTGLFSDYEGTITDCWFSNAAQNTPAQIHFRFKTDVAGHEEVEERYSLGPDWQTTDGGETVTHPTAKRFNRNTQAGILVDKVAELAGDIVRAKGSPQDHKTWVGLSFYMEATTRKGTRRDTGEEWSSTRNYPSRFLGEDNREAGRSSAPVWHSGLNEASMNAIIDLAGSLTHAEWVDKVLEVPGVLGNDALISALPDSSPDGLYERLKSQ